MITAIWITAYFLTGAVVAGLADVEPFKESPAMLGIWLGWPVYLAGRLLLATTHLGYALRDGVEERLEARRERKAQAALPEAKVVKR